MIGSDKIQITLGGDILPEKKDTPSNIQYGQETGKVLNLKTLSIDDLELVDSEGCKDLYSKNIELNGFNGITIAFQHTKKGGKIVPHNHDDTDELIILMNGKYGDIGDNKTKNGIMRISMGSLHGGKSTGNWISIKPEGYNFIESNEHGMIYEKSGEKILISVGSNKKKYKSSYVGNVGKIIMENDTVLIHANNLDTDNTLEKYILIGNLNTNNTEKKS